MTIYIESFLIQNILIDFCLLRLTEMTIKNKTNIFRLLLASIIGAGFSVLVSVFIKNNLTINILKFVCSISMILIAYKQTKKQFIYNLILLFLYTYALGGAVTALSASSYVTSFGVITSSKLSLEGITLLVIVLTYIFELVAKLIKNKMKTKDYIYSLTLIKKQKKVTVNAYLDTGNLLSFKGEPVIIVDLDVYLNLSGLNIAEYYLKPHEEIRLSTVAGENKLNVFRLDEIRIRQGSKNKIIHNQLVAVNSSNTFKNTNYQALLTPSII